MLNIFVNRNFHMIAYISGSNNEACGDISFQKHTRYLNGKASFCRKQESAQLIGSKNQWIYFLKYLDFVTHTKWHTDKLSHRGSLKIICVSLWNVNILIDSFLISIKDYVRSLHFTQMLYLFIFEQIKTILTDFNSSLYK